MLVLLPIFAGLLACMPEVAPVGNPERARIDPALTGVWVLEAADEEICLFVMEPWDKRTWATYLVSLDFGPNADDDERLPDTYDELVAMLTDVERNKAGKGIYGENVEVHKTWVTKLAGEKFMTWEQKAKLQEDGAFGSEFHMNWHFSFDGGDRFELRFIALESGYFEDVELADRRQLERTIRRHIDDEGFLDDEVFPFVKMQPEDAKHFSSLIDEALVNY